MCYFHCSYITQIRRDGKDMSETRGRVRQRDNSKIEVRNMKEKNVSMKMKVSNNF